MRIVALQAVRSCEGLVVVRLLNFCILCIMAIQAERWGCFSEMEPILRCWLSPGLVRQVACVASHIERGVSAALFRNIRSGLVAIEAQVILSISRRRFAELILVVGGVRIMACKTIANRRRVHGSLYVARFLVSVAFETKRVRSGGDEFDTGDVFVDSHFVATHAAHCHSGVDGFAFPFLRVAFKALGGIYVFVERDRMNLGFCARSEKRKQGSNDDERERASWAMAKMGKRLAACDEMRERAHTATNGTEFFKSPRPAKRLRHGRFTVSPQCANASSWQ